MNYSKNNQLTLFDDNELDKERFKYDKIYFESLFPIEPTPVYDMYWIFAKRRQDIFFNKLQDHYPLTHDPILTDYKFTNTYRASDRVSQYLIKDVIYKKTTSVLDSFFRIILFKLFNKIETWELLEKEFGEISFNNYDFENYDKFLSKLLSLRHSIYSAAYIMAPGKLDPMLKRKHSNHLKLIEMMIKDNLHIKIQHSKTFKDVFDQLISYPMIGQFLGYQLSIDLNYSELINFSEDAFVIPGPGALSGISKCFKNKGGLSDIEIIKFMKDRQELEFNRLRLDFKNLWGRPLALIDCQNIFCEVDKYSRVAFPDIKGISARKKIKQRYKPHPNKMKSLMYPPKWGINDKIIPKKNL